MTQRPRAADYLPADKRVGSDPAVMAGVPCLRGTRISVVTLLCHLAGVDPARVLAEFPQLTREDLSAVLEYAADQLDDDGGLI